MRSEGRKLRSDLAAGVFHRSALLLQLHRAPLQINEERSFLRDEALPAEAAVVGQNDARAEIAHDDADIGQAYTNQRKVGPRGQLACIVIY